jgi:peptidoglycan/xylan/chitin deacetylase (PgdA/CDA1 family)
MKPRVLASALAAVMGLCASAQASVDRPPQYVVMAFDNCTELDRWQEWSDFTAEMNRDGGRVHFTFFVSGVNFIANANRTAYQGPQQRPGAAMINFGGSADDVRKRVDYVNDLHRRGHEIASHAVGHFNGGRWSASDWAREFAAFDDVMRGVARNNGLPDSVSLAAPAGRMTGFRAPYLAHSPGLYATLKARGYRYDTSGNSAADAWPQKIDGIWRFNLARLRLNGSGRSVLSMDYNFFVAQSRAVDNPQRSEQFRQQVLQTYIDYFRSNYSGNRAPLHIGHHFFDYQRGAYRKALIAFASTVCGLPEVRCVTYAKLADIMDEIDPVTLAAYQKGDFTRASAPSLSVALKD